MNNSKIEKPFDKILMAKYPVYTRELYRYGQLIATVTIQPLSHEHHEIRVIPHIPKDKINIVIEEPVL